MRRKVGRIRLVPVLSFLLLIVAIVLWARSRRHADALGFYTPAGHLQGISSDKGGMLLFLSDIPFGREMGLGADAMSVPADDFVSVHDLLFDPSNVKWNLIGFHFAGGTFATWGWKFSALIVPYWVLVLLLIVLPVGSFRGTVVRMRRKRRGQCPTCGYDLRHSQDRCPECGTPVPGAAMASTNQVPATAPSISLAGILSWLLLGLMIAASVSALSRGRRAAARAATAPPEAALLNRPVRQLDVQGVGLERAIDSLARAAHVPISVDWKSLDPQRMARLIPLFASLRDVDLVPALRALCIQAGTDDPQAAQVWASSRSVSFGTSSAAPRIVRCYPVGDLLDQIQGHLHQEAADSETRNPVSASAVSNTLFVGNSYWTKSDSSEALSDLLMNSVTPDDWPGGGRNIGDLRIIARRLWVWQTQEGHAGIRAMVAELRSPINVTTGPTTDAAVNPHANLDQRIPELNLEATRLEGAIETLRQQTRANIVTYWASLEAAGFTRNMPIRMHLWDVTLGGALNSILAVSGGDAATMVTVRDGIILVATADVLRNGGTVVKVYDIHDLIDQLRNSDRPRTPTTLPAAERSNATGSVSKVMGDPMTVDEAEDSIAKLLEDTIDVDTWKDNGGSIGSLRGLGGMLIITQTPEAHHRIVGVLRTLRAGGSKEGMDLFQR